MSRVNLSEQARIDVSRVYDFLAHHDMSVALRAIDTIIASLTLVEQFPMGCPIVSNQKELRKLVIPFGESGYIGYYHYDKGTDISTLVQIKHQRESLRIANTSD